MIKKNQNKYHLKHCSTYELTLLKKHLLYHAHTIEIWERGMGEADLEHYEVKNNQTNDYSAGLIVEKKGNFLTKAVKSKINKELIYFKITIGQKTYCGKGKFTYLQGTEYSLILLDKIYIFEMRKNYRLKASEKIEIRAKFQEKKFDCIDISCESFALRVDIQDIEEFRINTISKDLKIAINDKVFKIPHFRTISIRELYKPDRSSANCFTVVCLIYKPTKIFETELNQEINYYAREIELQRISETV